MDLSYMAIINLRKDSSVHIFFRSFIIKWYWILLKGFSASIKITAEWFLSLALVIWCITYINYICLINPSSLGQHQLAHVIWSFKGVVMFCFAYKNHTEDFCPRVYQRYWYVTSFLLFLFSLLISEYCWFLRVNVKTLHPFPFHGKVWRLLVLFLSRSLNVAVTSQDLAFSYLGDFYYYSNSLFLIFVYIFYILLVEFWKVICI